MKVAAGHDEGAWGNWSRRVAGSDRCLKSSFKQTMGHGLWLGEESQEEARNGGRAEAKVQEVGRRVDPRVRGQAEDREERDCRGVLGLSERMK